MQRETKYHTIDRIDFDSNSLELNNNSNSKQLLLASIVDMLTNPCRKYCSCDKPLLQGMQV